MSEVTSREFQKESGRFRAIAHREAVTITNYGREDLVLISSEEYKRLRRLDRRAMHVSELSDKELANLGAVEIPAEASRYNDEVSEARQFRMSFDPPVPGEVIRYSYLWCNEARQGQEEGLKDKPGAVVFTRKTEGNDTPVYVLPITHTLPHEGESAPCVCGPLNMDAALRLRSATSWQMR